MATKFTPGPWGADASALAVFNETDQSLIADVNHSGSDEESEANANLIASAPEMYDALKELVRCVRGGDNTAGVSMDDALLDADTALENADGGAR